MVRWLALVAVSALAGFATAGLAVLVRVWFSELEWTRRRRAVFMAEAVEDAEAAMVAAAWGQPEAAIEVLSGASPAARDRLAEWAIVAAYQAGTGDRQAAMLWIGRLADGARLNVSLDEAGLLGPSR